MSTHFLLRSESTRYIIVHVHYIRISIPTRDPIWYYIIRRYIPAQDFEYLAKCLCGLLYAARGMENFAMVSLHRDLKTVEAPSKYLFTRLSIYRSGTIRSNLPSRYSLDDTLYWMRRKPVPVQVTVSHVHNHLVSGTFSREPRENHHVHMRGQIARNTWR